MTPYATSTELASYLGVSEGSLPADVDRMLERASTLIDSIPTLRAFETDSGTNLPVDGDVAAAMRDAVSAQVEYWFEIGGGSQNPNSAGEAHDILRLPGDGKIGSVEVPTLRKFAPRALDGLRAAGLLRSGVSPGQGSSLASSFFD